MSPSEPSLSSLSFLLSSLRCPLLRHLSATHFFSPHNSFRLNLWEWLLLNYDPRILGEEDSYSMQIGVRVEKLTKAISSLGLCKADEIDLISGESPNQKRQLEIICTLAEMVQITFNHSDEPGEGFIPESATKAVLDDSALLTNLCQQRRMADVIFSTENQLFPEHNFLFATKKSETKLTLEEISAIVTKLEASAAQLQAQIETLRREDSPQKAAAGEEVENAADLEKRLQGSLSSLVAACTQFNQAYQQELRPWIPSKLAKVSDLGEVSSRTLQTQARVQDYLGTLESMREATARAWQDLEDSEQQEHRRDLIAELKTSVGVIEKTLQLGGV